MTLREMTLERFKEIVSAYGTISSHWPGEEREEAVKFAAANEDARSFNESLKNLDLALDELAIPQPATEAFLDRLINLPDTKPSLTRGAVYQPDSEVSSGGFFGGLGDLVGTMVPGFRLPQLAGLMSVCILGVFLGLSNVARYDQTTTSIDASAYFLSNPSLSADLREFN